MDPPINTLKWVIRTDYCSKNLSQWKSCYVPFKWTKSFALRTFHSFNFKIKKAFQWSFRRTLTVENQALYTLNTARESLTFAVYSQCRTTDKKKEIILYLGHINYTCFSNQQLQRILDSWQFPSSRKSKAASFPSIFIKKCFAVKTDLINLITLCNSWNRINIEKLVAPPIDRMPTKSSSRSN